MGPFHGEREWVYAQDVRGKYHTIHRISASLLHVWLFVGPWLMLDGRPLFRFELDTRRIYAFGQIFTAQDGVLIMLSALLAAVALFFFTSLFGRLWCGYTCPQSVFIINWVLPIEQFIEGDRGERLRRDKKGVRWSTTFRKGLKFLAFAAIALALSGSFMGFFVDPRVLWTGGASTANYTVLAFFTTLWFVDFAWFREQACNYLCPYARFQSVLMDEETLTVAYDMNRGEPRQKGKLAKGEDHCVDCNRCVVVCPTGIDIRDGFQLECWSCGRCADACEDVMGRFDLPSLVYYSTEAELEGKTTRWLRPRSLLYASVLAAVVAAITGVIALRDPFQATVNRAPGSLFVVDDDGWTRNTFLVHIVNTQPTEGTFTIDVEGIDGVEVTAPERILASTAEATVPLVVRAAPGSYTSRTVPITVQVKDGDRSVAVPVTFKTQAKEGG
ncbi:MAG: cytochrome c oxidase accessory protein CcoG [Deltaproteobacteria bacterium]|nr:MAG: cytochrome c oxidase accessory protein CcoG [Deltaproteobacteria bacterium]